MIYTFRFLSDEEESFVLDVNINHDQTFERMHLAIQEALDFDAEQLASFYTSNAQWEKLYEITLADMGVDSLVKLMSETKIEEYFSKKGQHILYVFDYFAERLLFGSIVRVIDAESPISLPSISKFEGTVPEQFMDDDGYDEMDLDGDDMDPDDFDYEDLPEDFHDFNPEEY